MALVLCRNCSREQSYNTEGNRNLVVSQVSCRMDVTQLEQHAYSKITVLRGRNARECHSDLVEAAGENALS